MKLVLVIFVFLQNSGESDLPSITSRLNYGEWIALGGFVLAIILAFTAIITGLIKLSYKAGGLNASLERIIPLVDKIPVIADRIDSIWERKVTVSNSPMQLNDVGKKILIDSNIEAFTNKYIDSIIELVKGSNPENAYQAQESIIKATRSFKDNEECKSLLEVGAFESGSDVDTILLVAAVHIRDEIIEKLNFNKEDIDKHDPSNNKK